MAALLESSAGPMRRARARSPSFVAPVLFRLWDPQQGMHACVVSRAVLRVRRSLVCGMQCALVARTCLEVVGAILRVGSAMRWPVRRPHARTMDVHCGDARSHVHGRVRSWTSGLMR